MGSKRLNLKETLYDFTERYKESIPLLIAMGFDNLKDETQRNVIGKQITLEMALKSKGISPTAFEEKVLESMEGELEDKNRLTDKQPHINVSGVLPCPVRIPLLEAFEKWLEDNQQGVGVKIDYDLRAASMGVDWLKERLVKEDPHVIPDLFISAGFDLFFDDKLFGHYREKGFFKDITIHSSSYHPDFSNDKIDLRDPKGQYSMIGVVPAVFLVNTDELNGSKMPKTWDDILSDTFQHRVSLPVGDFDLFNAIMLNIHKKYGDDGIRKLKKSMLRSMHPSEMVKSHVKKYNKPTVTIMPYFFTKLVKGTGPMQAVWPEDGAIISPIFMLTKKEKVNQLKPIADFYASKEIGEILAHNGRFPSTNPEVDNRVPEENSYRWLSWEYIENNDIGQLIRHCERIFNEEA